MISITPAAAQKIIESARQGQSEGLALRVAAMRKDDGSIHYAMGFDDVGGKEDLRFTSENVDIVIDSSNAGLLDGTIIDYVELDSGEMNFIFKNPNDPNYATAQGGKA